MENKEIDILDEMIDAAFDKNAVGFGKLYKEAMTDLVDSRLDEARVELYFQSFPVSALEEKENNK